MQTRPADSLAEECAVLDKLLQLLRQEQAHLVDADVEALSGLTGEKAQAAARMAELAKGRHRALAAAGFEASEAGMQAWIANANADEARAWNALLEQARSAKELNRVNGLLINQHMGRNQAALNVLQGGAQGGSFYGPNGQSATTFGSRRLVVG
jgi:flagella synthesis protein FlgN